MRRLLFVMLLTAVACLGATAAFADDCATLGGSVVLGECQIPAGTHNVGPGTFTVTETLHTRSLSTIQFTCTGTNPPPVTLNVQGDLIMDDQSVVSGNTTSNPGHGCDMTINVTGNISMQGGSSTAAGAKISSDQVAGSCTGQGSRGGNITINDPTGTLTMGGGNNPNASPINGGDPSAARIESVSPCGLGKILITALSTDIDGVVISQGTTTQGKGGPVTVNASCNFKETPTGLILSLGRDPGSDLVHVQGGCDVSILGVVRSYGAGHLLTPSVCNGALPDFNGQFRPVGAQHPANSEACTEVWSGGKLTIDASGSNRGEVGADTGFSGGVDGTSWVEIFAAGDIKIIGDTNPAQSPPATFAFAVHADQGLTNGKGGQIRVYSTDGAVDLQHLAIDASDLGGGSKGGSVDVQSKTIADFTNEGKIRADGSTSGGLTHAGGDISVRVFGTAPASGNITAAVGSLLDVTGGPPLGTIELEACGTIAFPPGSTTPAAVTPTKTTGVCGGNPVLPSYVQSAAGPGLPPCVCICACATGFTPTTFTATAQTGGDLTITGNNLNAVVAVVFGANCDPGSAAATVPKASFVSQSDSQIVVSVPALADGTYKIVIQSNDGGSCCAPGVFTKP